MKTAIELLNHYTKGSLDPFVLMGRDQVKLRQNVLSELRGRRVAQREAGVNALASELFEALEAEGRSPAARLDDFREKARKFLSPQGK